MQNRTNNYIHIMKYMGSKRELLGAIRDTIDSVDIKRPVVLDVFAGTCSVGMSLKDKYGVISTDIQSYSEVIAKACIELEPLEELAGSVLEHLERGYDANYSCLSYNLNDLLKQSADFIDIKTWSEDSLAEYIEFIGGFSSMALGDRATSAGTGWLLNQYKLGQENKDRFPYTQTTFLFGEMYFSLNQAVAIDSIRYAIDQLPSAYARLKPALLASLIHAHSYASAGTGHFAQFRDLNSLSSVEDVFKYRGKSVYTYFLHKFEEIISQISSNNMRELSMSLTGDYEGVLQDPDIMNKVGIIYADPPYSFVHYSRFYHAVEDLCRYDYPVVEHKGRYRMDRHQSPFCIKSKVPSAFRRLLESAAKFDVPLLISYSNTGMITLEQLRDIALEEGFDMTVRKIDHKHSTMGRAGDKDRDVTEALLLCRSI